MQPPPEDAKREPKEGGKDGDGDDRSITHTRWHGEIEALRNLFTKERREKRRRQNEAVVAVERSMGPSLAVAFPLMIPAPSQQPAMTSLPQGGG
jgi:hypothetical protein